MPIPPVQARVRIGNAHRRDHSHLTRGLPGAVVQHPIRHLHHVTDTVAQAQPDLDFCEGILGLRLVKRTVNFDNHSVYHFYYGTERGAPGTIWTTFPYAGWSVPPGVHGAGQIVATTFSVPRGAIAHWRSRADAAGLDAEEGAERFGERPLVLRD